MSDQKHIKTWGERAAEKFQADQILYEEAKQQTVIDCMRAEISELRAELSRRTQPEATAPAQDDLRNGLCDKSWTKIRYKGFTYSFPASMPLPQVFSETLALTDEAPAQDLSAAILPKPVNFTEKGAPLYTQGQVEDCIKNALSAGDREPMTLVKKDGQPYAAYPRRKQAEVYASGLSSDADVEIIDGVFTAAILQSQKGNKV